MARESLYDKQILAPDIETGRCAGSMIDRGMATGHNPGFADVVSAATAAVRGRIVVTRNRKHFEPLGVATLDPFMESPLPEPA